MADIEAVLDVPLAPDGTHPTMGTHNRLLSLGPEEYLELIAVDPAAPDPGRARWFALDHFAGAPRLTNWICRTDDLAAALAQAPAAAGRPIALRRGDLNWRMAVPDDGRLPFDGGHPALMTWDGPHPAARLPDMGCRLAWLEVGHPEAEALRGALAALDDPRIRIIRTEVPRLRAGIITPGGEQVIE